MYTLQATDIDNGGEFFRKLNSNFAECANPQSSHTDAECRTRFIAEMNRKAALLGMTNTTFYDPAGNQPIASADPTWAASHPNAFYSSNHNVSTAIDLLKLLIYASGIRELNDAQCLPNFILSIGGANARTANIVQTVKNAEFEAAYTLLIGKTGSMDYLQTRALVCVVQSKTTDKIYACAEILQTTTDSYRWTRLKEALDSIDAGGAAPSYANSGIAISLLPTFTPSLFKGVSPDLAFNLGSNFVWANASTTKLMTAAILADCKINLDIKVSVHESDISWGTGTLFYQGDIITLRDALKCAFTESSNTSAHIITRVVGGILLDKDENVLE